MKKNLKLFLFVLIINLLFSQIVGDDNLNRIFYSLSIARNKTLFLDNYQAFIGDTIKIKEHYLSTKSPGISFLASPIYLIIERILNNSTQITLLKESLNYSKLSVLTLPNSLIVFSLVSILFFSALPGALLFLLINKFTKNVYISLFLYFSSLLFPYSTTLFSYTFSIFLILFAFTKKHKILSPFLLGLAVFFEFTSIFLVVIVLFYLRKKIKLFYFFVGALPSIVYIITFPSIFLYLFGLTQLFLLTPSSSLTYFLQLNTSFLTFLSNVCSNILFLLFSPYRGIFFYFPLLFLFFLYYKNLKNDLRKIATYSLVIYLLFNSILDFWWGSLSFGPRHMVYSVPFVLLAISQSWKKINKKLFYLYVLVSLFITSSSFTYWEGARKTIKDGSIVYVTGVYKKGEIYFNNQHQLVSFPPILDHYLASLIENGPRSRLVESLFTDRPLDLRYLLPEDRDYFLCVYGFPPYLSALILLFLFLIFFWDEIKSRKILLSLILIAILSIVLYNLYYFGMFDSFKKANKIELKYGFYPKDLSGNIFVYKKGIVYIFSNNSEDKVISINLRAFPEDRRVTIIFNGEKIGDFNISSGYDNRISFPSYIKKGKNVLEMMSDTCTRPIELNISDDKRCISLVFNSIDISDLNKKEPVFVEGFFIQNKSSIYAGKYGKIYIYSESNNPMIVSMEVTSFLKDREVYFYLNSDLIGKSYVFKEGEEIYLPLKLKSGLNTLEIQSKDCSIPSEEDKRCLSVAIYNISLISLDQLENKLIFSKGWYNKAKEDDYRWGSNFSELLYISPQDAIFTFYFDILPVYNETTIVEFYLNGELKNIFEIARGGGWVYTLPQKINKGINYLEFKVPRGCVVIDDLLHNGDKRCIAMTLRGVRVEK